MAATMTGFNGNGAFALLMWHQIELTHRTAGSLQMWTISSLGGMQSQQQLDYWHLQECRVIVL